MMCIEVRLDRFADEYTLQPRNSGSVVLGFW